MKKNKKPYYNLPPFPVFVDMMKKIRKEWRNGKWVVISKDGVEIF